MNQGTQYVDTYFNDLNTILEELKLFRLLPHCSCDACNIDCFKRFVTLQENDYAFNYAF